MEKSCCFTGYRPGKFPFSLRDGCFEYESLKTEITAALLDFQAEGFTTFYTGAAMGFDLIAAEQALALRDRYKATELKIICAIPFATQADVYFPGCYQQRNRWMVDRSAAVLTWFDGQAGGTKNTLTYAKRQNRKIVNLNIDESVTI
ncbi:MAG: DUF1273 domain-containing protein [Clostridia bacterium]|nr:DUF1273 domain-containing protein [Clostridia bacterium]